MKGKKVSKAASDSEVKKQFDELIGSSVDKLDKFVGSKAEWATDYVATLQERVSKLQSSEEFSPLSRRNSFRGGDSSSKLETGSSSAGASHAKSRSSSSNSLVQLGAGISIEEDRHSSSSEDDDFSPVDPEDSSLSPPASTTSSGLTNEAYSRTGSLKDICRETADNQHFKVSVVAMAR